MYGSQLPGLVSNWIHHESFCILSLVSASRYGAEELNEKEGQQNDVRSVVLHLTWSPGP